MKTAKEKSENDSADMVADYRSSNLVRGFQYLFCYIIRTMRYAFISCIGFGSCAAKNSFEESNFFKGDDLGNIVCCSLYGEA
ncbi:MAG: hypothetical protein HFG92_15245 [Dorea sp.]|nr:hypothetical protein [Dorea sp.]